MAAHDLEQYERGVHIVLVVFKGLFDGFADGLETCKVDAGVKLVFVKDLVQCGFVTDVCVYERNGFANEFCHTTERFVARIHQIIDNNNGMTGFVKLNDGMASDVTCATHNSYFHNCSNDKSSRHNIRIFLD